MKTASKTFFVTLTYDSELQDSIELTDENIECALKYVTEASFVNSVSVNARKAHVPAEIPEEKMPVVLH